MDDDKILARGGDEHDIESYAKQNGADLTFADVLKEANRHHYGKDAHSYAISAYANPELRQVMALLVGEDGIKSLQ